MKLKPINYYLDKMKEIHNNKKDSKICSICKKDKKLSEFNKSSRMLDGYRSQYKSCSSEIGKKYYNSKKIINMK